tara:strand:- start:223 stop:462 length:240 start_codon:yes stop_codon:yes gene_type:complete
MFTVTNILLLMIFIAIVWVAILLSSYLLTINANLVSVLGAVNTIKDSTEKTWLATEHIDDAVKDIKKDVYDIEAHHRLK